MSRPRYEPGSKMARERIVDSFWKLLSCKPYEKLSVRELIRAAEVNKNTFYHHFENIDDLAQQAIDEALPKELGRFFLESGGASRESIIPFMDTPDAAIRFDRVKIMLSDNGVALQGRIKQKVLEAWQEVLGLEEYREDQRRLALFLAGGIISTLQGQDPRDYPGILLELSSTKPIRAFMEVLGGWREREQPKR